MRYARTADGLYIAFQVAGEGSLDIVEIGDGTLFPIDATNEQARWQTYVDRLSSFSRLIRFDLRGIGLSDPLGSSSPLTLEQWATDTLAVLDAVSSESAVLMGVAQFGTAGIFLAATHPERTQALQRVIQHMTDQVVMYSLYYSIAPTMVSNRMVNVGFYPSWNTYEWDVK